MLGVLVIALGGAPSVRAQEQKQEGQVLKQEDQTQKQAAQPQEKPKPTEAPQWLPGYTNNPPWVKGQLEEQKADAKVIDGKKVQVVFLGDSITCFWRKHEALWQKSFGQWTPLNLGIGSDNTEHIRWRLANGPKYGLEPEGVDPKVVVLMAGTNNLGGPAEKRAEAVGALLKDVQERWPKAVVVLMSITPRGKGPGDKDYDAMQATNPLIAKLADGKRVIWLDLAAQMTWDGSRSKGVSDDMVHYTEEGYQMWVDLLTPVLKAQIDGPGAAGPAVAGAGAGATSGTIAK